MPLAKIATTGIEAGLERGAAFVLLVWCEFLEHRGEHFARPHCRFWWNSWN